MGFEKNVGIIAFKHTDVLKNSVAHSLRLI